MLVRDLAVVLALDLRRGSGKEVDGTRARVSGVGSRAKVAAVVAGHVRSRVAGVRRGVRMRWRDIGRADLRAGRRLRCLLRRRHTVHRAWLVLLLLLCLPC